MGVCECEAACDDLPDCVAFVDNKKPSSGAPACSLKSSSSTLHEASDVTAKDVYYKPHHAPPSLTTSPPSPSAPLPIASPMPSYPPGVPSPLASLEAPPPAGPSTPPPPYLPCADLQAAAAAAGVSLDDVVQTNACYLHKPSDELECKYYWTWINFSQKQWASCEPMGAKDQCMAGVTQQFCGMHPPPNLPGNDLHEAPAAPPPAAPPVIAPSHPPGCITVADASNFTYTAAWCASIPHI